MKKSFIQLKKSLTKAFMSLSSDKLEDGTEIVYDSETIYNGLAINKYDDNGELIPLEDGEYTIKGARYKVANGEIVEELTDEEPQPQKEPVKMEAETPDIEAVKADIEALKDEIKTLSAAVEATKASIEEIKKLLDAPQDKPAPAPKKEVAMADEAPNVMGTKFEKAYKIFNIK